MVLYVCPRCDREFNKKQNYEIHIHRKFPCEEKKGGDNVLEEMRNPIHAANKIIAYEREINRLKDLLEEKNIIIEEKNIIIQDLLKEKNTLLVNNTTTKAPSNNITINADNVMINMAAFGSETASMLYRQEKVNVLKSGDSCVISMIKHIHDNDRLPEFRNICVTNMRAAGGYVYEHNTWKFNNYDDMLHMLMNARMSDLEDLIRDEDITKEIMNINRIKEIVNDYWGDSDKFMKAHKQKIITALYNYTKDNMNRYTKLVKSS
jgi:hypothetical protein